MKAAELELEKLVEVTREAREEQELQASYAATLLADAESKCAEMFNNNEAAVLRPSLLSQVAFLQEEHAQKQHVVARMARQEQRT